MEDKNSSKFWTGSLLRGGPMLCRGLYHRQQSTESLKEDEVRTASSRTLTTRTL